MAAFLVTGNLGSGKSTLAQELSRQGLATIDPDCDPMLSYWEDDGGTPVPKTEDPAAPDEQWLRAHRWVWNRSLLQDLVNQEPGPVFGSGIALNIDQVLDLLTRVFVLRIDAATQQERPHSRSGCSHTTRATRDGRSEAARQQIRDGRHIFEAQMLELGAVEELRQRTLLQISYSLSSWSIDEPSPRPQPCSGLFGWPGWFVGV